jgi:minor curlin subunit
MMTTVRAKLHPLSAAALLATLCGPVSADYNMNTTIQDGRVNTNDAYQRGPANENATRQEGRDNANRTRQRGGENWNATAQFGRVNCDETHQERYFKRAKDDRRGCGGDHRALGRSRQTISWSSSSLSRQLQTTPERDAKTVTRVDCG